eukprot:1161370-Pelagomonas_calceolata.AAC.4
MPPDDREPWDEPLGRRISCVPCPGQFPIHAQDEFAAAPLGLKRRLPYLTQFLCFAPARLHQTALQSCDEEQKRGG